MRKVLLHKLVYSVHQSVAKVVGNYKGHLFEHPQVFGRYCWKDEYNDGQAVEGKRHDAHKVEAEAQIGLVAVEMIGRRHLIRIPF